jgi:hypothetical protein
MRDLARWAAAGEREYLGRIGDETKRGGVSIFATGC